MLDLITIAIGIFLVAGLLIVSIVWIYPRSKTNTTIPGLSPSCKINGNLGDLSRAGSLHEFLMEIHAKFGPITGFWWGQTYVVSIASPQLAREHSNVFDRPEMLFKSFEPVLGQKSVTYANGLDGRNRRRQYDGSFSHDKISKYMYTFTKLTERVEVKWLQKGNDDHINVTEDCFRYAIQGSLLSVMGEDFEDEKFFCEFRTSHEKVWYTLEDNINTGIPLDEKQQDEFDKALSFLKKSIVDTIAQRKKDDLYLQGDSFIDELIALWSDEETIAEDALTFLIAGFHTGANLLIWAIYFIATHQDVQEKLLEEIHRVIGEKESVDEHNYSQFVYLMQILQETLRCAVIAPWAARFQDIDSELGGHKIEKNTPVIQALGVMMKDAQIWPEPNKFDPERFNAANKKKISHYDYLPFGFAGKRKCPGYRLSYWNAVVLIATLVRRFEIVLCADQVISPVYGLVTHLQEDVWVKIQKRQ